MGFNEYPLIHVIEDQIPVLFEDEEIEEEDEDIPHVVIDLFWGPEVDSDTSDDDSLDTDIEDEEENSSDDVPDIRGNHEIIHVMKNEEYQGHNADGSDDPDQVIEITIDEEPDSDDTADVEEIAWYIQLINHMIKIDDFYEDL